MVESNTMDFAKEISYVKAPLHSRMTQGPMTTKKKALKVTENRDFGRITEGGIKVGARRIVAKRVVDHD